MRKLYIVRLTKHERVERQSVVKKLKGTGQKVRRAQILLRNSIRNRLEAFEFQGFLRCGAFLLEFLILLR